MAGKNIGMSDEALLLRAHWNDLARRAVRDGHSCFTGFVPAEDESVAEEIARAADAVCTAWGGTEHTARVMLCFSPKEIPIAAEQFPIRCLTLSYRAAKLPEHRDILGACMACNLERDRIGDILIDARMAQIFVCKQVASVLLRDLHQVGRIGVAVTEEMPVCLSAEASFTPLHGTIASLRADAVAAFVTHLSREKALQIIRQGRMICCHTVIETPSAAMQVGDVFSIRGYGKFRIDSMEGVSRKGRYHITIQKY